MQALNARCLSLRASCGHDCTHSQISKPLQCRAALQPRLFAAPLQRRQPAGVSSTAVGFFKLGGQTSQSGGVYGSQARDDYTEDDVEQYFNYMGMLADEGSYDTLENALKSGLHPADILLLWAAKENDTPKAAELLRAGADANVKDADGKTPADLTTDEEIKAMMKDLQIAEDYQKDER